MIILRYHEVFSRLSAPRCAGMAVGAASLKKTSWYRNIIILLGVEEHPKWATQKGHIIFALWRHDHRSPKKMRSKIQSHTSIRSLDWVWPEWWWGRVLCIDQIFVFTTLAIFTNDKEWKIGHKMVEIMCHYHRFQSDIEPDLLVSESSQMLNLTNIKRIWDETNPRSRGSGSLTKILRGK